MNGIETLRKKLIMRLSTLAFLACATGAAGYALNSGASSSQGYNAKLTSDIRGLEGNIQKFKSDNIRREQAMEIWNKMTEGEKAFNGLRLGEAKEALDRMIGKYWLSNVKTTFSKPILIDGRQDGFQIAKSDVSVTFDAVSDAMALDFLEEMNASFPGKIRVTRFEMEKNQDLTKSFIKDISTGQRPALFSGLMEFDWRDIKK
ncbi:MAG: hypothetical protein ABW189_05730 [Rickettsiales bacterium]